jgi:tripartite ATP-independent transporter DctP family solute receptor
MKRLSILTASLCLLATAGLILAIHGCKRPDEDKVVLHAAETHPAGYPTTQGLYRMAELVKERSEGRIEIKIHHSGSMGNEKETIEKTQKGGLDINRVNINPLAQVVPEMKVLALPYIFRSEEHMHKVCDGDIGQELLKTVESADLVGLAYYDSGQRSFYSSKPLKSIDDLKGLKIRVQKAEIMNDMTRALGASPTPMAFSEVYTSLQTGTIDGAENNYPSWIGEGHYEVAKNYLEDGHSRAPEIILFSKKTWDRLSAEDQQLLRQAALDSVEFQRKKWDEEVEKARQKALDAGCTIVTDVDTQAFQDAMKPVYDKHAKGLESWIEKIRAVE